MNSVTISTFHMVSHNLIFLFRFEDFMYRNNDCNNRPKKVFRISGWKITKLSFDQNKCVLYLNIWIRLHLLKKSFMFFQCKINYRVWVNLYPDTYEIIYRNQPPCWKLFLVMSIIVLLTFICFILLLYIFTVLI